MYGEAFSEDANSFLKGAAGPLEMGPTFPSPTILGFPLFTTSVLDRSTLCDANPERVLELIDWEHCKWREEQVRATFLLDDTDLIIKIHPVDAGVQDCVIWNGEANGSYSVKLGYHLLWRRKEVSGEVLADRIQP